MHPLWFYKHQHDNRVCSKLFVACQRWWFQWWFWFVPSDPGYLREEEEHKPDPWHNPIERNQMGLHLENEVAVVKIPTIISNNPVLLFTFFTCCIIRCLVCIVVSCLLCIVVNCLVCIVVSCLVCIVVRCLVCIVVSCLVCIVVSCLVCIVVSCLVCIVVSCLLCIVVVFLCVLLLVVLCVLL